jgi:probable HAF family extracellular repeat protein
VNRQGEVAGTAVIAGRPRAFLFRNGEYLDPTPGWAFSEAAFVAEDGAVTGSGEFGAYLSRNGVPELLPGFSVVVGVNASGHLLGSAENTVRLFLPGTGTITLSPPGSSAAVPGGLNESGLATVSSRQENAEKGYVYSGGFYVFMIPPGWSSSKAMAINNRSEVVGYGMSPAGRRSFLRSGPTYNELSFPGWTATEAVSLNDLGQVAGSGETASGETHAFLASPAGSATPGNGPEGDAVASGGGGCGMVDGGRGTPFTSSAAMSLLALFLPLLPYALRREKNRHGRSPAASR